jgi:hypothetical protein
MLEMNMRHVIQGIILGVGVSLVGGATAQESGPIPAAPEIVQRTTGEVDQVATGIGAASAISAPGSNAPQTAPAPRIVWDSAAPELDTFGNETVPIFHSTYSGK